MPQPDERGLASGRHRLTLCPLCAGTTAPRLDFFLKMEPTKIFHLVQIANYPIYA